MRSANTAEEIVDAWKKSPTHYANLIDGDYKDIGVGLTGGIYRGEPTVYIAQHLATPVAAVTTKANQYYSISTNEREIAVSDDVGSVLAEKLVSVRQSVPPVISISGSTPVEKYIHAKSSLGSVTKIFEVSRYVFLAALIFFAAALCLKIFVQFRRQHPLELADALQFGFIFVEDERVEHAVGQSGHPGWQPPSTIATSPPKLATGT